MAKELVYGSCPSGLDNSLRTRIMDLAASEDKGCLHPFNALPHGYFEGGVMGREKSIEYYCRLIDVCDEFWLFGISEGTLIETQHFLEQNNRLENPKPLRNYIYKYDPEWEKYYGVYENKFGLVLARLNL